MAELREYTGRRADKIIDVQFWKDVTTNEVLILDPDEVNVKFFQLTMKEKAVVHDLILGLANEISFGTHL